MKFYIPLLCLSIFIFQILIESKHKCPPKKRNHNLRAPLVQSPLISSDGLPSTPKAMTLKNHFGADPSDSPYGPQPTLIRTVISTKYPDGSIKTTNQTEVIHLPEGVFSECEIKSQKFHAICFNLKTCDLCASHPHCGWCQSTQKCLPGKLKAPTCAKACLHSWIFNLKKCEGMVFGIMSNVAPEAIDLVPANITEPKVKVDTVITHPAVVKTPVLLGKVITKNEYSKVNLTDGNIVRTDVFNYEQPILGEVQQVMNVDTHHTQYIGLDSGKRLDNDHPKKSLHGKETFAFKEINTKKKMNRNKNKNNGKY